MLAPAGGGVSSVFSRTGAVVAAAGDYSATQVTNAAATNVANTFTAGPQTVSVGSVVVSSVGAGPTVGTFTGVGSNDGGLFLYTASGAPAGFFTEATGQILSAGINKSQVGPQTTANPGGIFRLDARAGTPFFYIVRRASGQSTEKIDLVHKLNDNGELRIGGNSTSTTFDGQLQVVCNSASQKGVTIKAAASQSQDLFQIQDSSAGLLWSVSPAGATTWAGQTTSQSQAQYRVSPSWATATDASRKARVQFTVYDATAAREFLRGETDGTQPLLSFFGASAVAKPTVTGAKGGNAALGSLLAALVSLGLITDTTTA